MVWITVRVIHHNWKVDILVIPCFREISIISTTENSVIMLVAFPKSKVLEKCKEARRKPCIPPVEIKENEIKGMSKKISSSIPKPFQVIKIN